MIKKIYIGSYTFFYLNMLRGPSVWAIIHVSLREGYYVWLDDKALTQKHCSYFLKLIN